MTRETVKDNQEMVIEKSWNISLQCLWEPCRDSVGEAQCTRGVFCLERVLNSDFGSTPNINVANEN